MANEDEQVAEQIAAEIEKRLAKKHEAIEAAVKKAEELQKGFGDRGKWDETLKRMDEEAKTLSKRLDETLARLNTPAIDTKKQHSELTKAFREWMRRGDKAGPEAIKALATDDEADGGFMVPEPLRGRMLEALIETSPIRARAEVITITRGNAFENPVEEGSFAVTKNPGERGARSETSTGTFGLRRNQLHELYAMPGVTQTMLDDGVFDVEAYISRKVGQYVGRQANEDYLKGTGAGEPEGLTTNPDTVETETAGSGELVADDVLELLYSLPDTYAQRAELFAHRKIHLALRKLKDVDEQYLWQPSVQAGEPATFFGTRINRMPDMDDAATANKKVLIYTDLSDTYQVVEKPTVPMLRDPFTAKPKVLFYTTWRHGGLCVRPAGVGILKVKA